MPAMWQVYLVILAVLSPVTAAAYLLDKRAAQRGRWRTPESTLHMLALLGGWPGAIIGARLARHKTRKLSFRAVSWAIIALHAALIVWWIWGRVRGS